MCVETSVCFEDSVCVEDCECVDDCMCVEDAACVEVEAFDVTCVVVVLLAVVSRGEAAGELEPLCWECDKVELLDCCRVVVSELLEVVDAGVVMSSSSSAQSISISVSGSVSRVGQPLAVPPEEQDANVVVAVPVTEHPVMVE